MEYGEKRFDEFRVGDKAVFVKSFTGEDVDRFADLSGDHYPVHLDEEYAKTTRFGRRVVHGMLTASLFSTTNGLLLQRPGGITVEQSLKFLRPVFLGDTITACTELLEILPESRRLRCRTTCINQHGEIVLTGECIEQKDQDPS